MFTSQLKKNSIAILIILAMYLLAFSSIAQEKIQLTLRWNSSNKLYDVYGKPNFTRSNYPLGPIQISIVSPKNAPNSNLITFGYEIGFSNISSLYEPTPAPQFDFFALNSSGNKVDFEAEKEFLFFSFKFSDNICRDGVRIFNNDSDPNASTPGMFGLDFSNSIYGVPVGELYELNYNNLGSNCDDCQKLICIPFNVKKTIKL